MISGIPVLISVVWGGKSSVLKSESSFYVYAPVGP